MSDHAGVAGRVRVGVASKEGFRCAMAAVDIEGFNGTAGREVLRYARMEVVGPAVAARRLVGLARDDAIAAGWEAAWRASTTRAVRNAVSPWGAIYAAVDRAIGGEYLADRYGCSVRSGWRRAGSGDPLPMVVPAEPMVLAHAVDKALEAVPRPSLAERLGERLGWIRDALVAGGWPCDLAEEALICVASNSVKGKARERRKRTSCADGAGDAAAGPEAVTFPRAHQSGKDVRGATILAADVPRTSGPHGTMRETARVHVVTGSVDASDRPIDARKTVRGWRVASGSLGLEPWQLRRLAVLVAGSPTHIGLLEVVIREGRGVLESPVVRRAIATTTRRWAPCPSSVIAAYFVTDTAR